MSFFTGYTQFHSILAKFINRAVKKGTMRIKWACVFIKFHSFEQALA